MRESYTFFLPYPFNSSDILREIRLLEHFSQNPLFYKLFSRAMLFGEQSIASLPKKHSFLPKEALLDSRGICFLYKIKRKNVLNSLLVKTIQKNYYFCSSRHAVGVHPNFALKMR